MKQTQIKRPVKRRRTPDYHELEGKLFLAECVNQALNDKIERLLIQMDTLLAQAE